MSKKVIVEAVAREAGMTQAAADKVVSAVLDAIGAELAKGEKVSFPGFGTFEVRERAARTGRNPQTGAEIQIAASKAPAFKAGSKLKERVSG
ncbi:MULTISPECIES: HU family DNA-binding protein [Ornithinimicrobium]|jgi:DNA-binding protein HU-beta|uniref:DNA-binding protein HU-beta n=2 Tax=Ornithinimicrobium TaxID=125287 RepID=A0A543K6U7_9MICO|nr:MULTISPECIES: HU family DNA-binding protein [Ornithinimicrobium]TQM90807.1 DNA-binding protein HU-beta [Ornithinimicrobium humiphilum]GGK72951.1 transcriptional regulator [Ornithinimicrobium pekingense]